MGWVGLGWVIFAGTHCYALLSSPPLLPQVNVSRTNLLPANLRPANLLLNNRSQPSLLLINLAQINPVLTQVQSLIQLNSPHSHCPDTNFSCRHFRRALSKHSGRIRPVVPCSLILTARYLSAAQRRIRRCRKSRAEQSRAEQANAKRLAHSNDANQSSPKGGRKHAWETRE